MIDAADDYEGGPGKPVPDLQVEVDALAEIVAVQAQAINDMIRSLNNLQARVAALEAPEQPSTNGDKKRVILLQ